MRKFFLLRLSDCESQIMDILWSAGKSLCVHDVLELWKGEPKPSYNTVSTHLTRLTHKRFIEYKKRSGDKTLYYAPVINRARYHQRLIMSVALTLIICLTAVAGILLSLPFISVWKNDGQDNAPLPADDKEKTVIVPDTINEPLDKNVNIHPSFTAEFIGGEDSIQSFFEHHWNHENEGRVYLRLLIDKSGKVCEAKAIMDPSTNPDMAKEVESIAVKMPHWKPATEEGSPVASMVTICVVLLNDD